MGDDHSALTTSITRSFSDAIEAALGKAEKTVSIIRTGEGDLKELVFYFGHFLVKLEQYCDCFDLSHLTRLGSLIVTDRTPEVINNSNLEEFTKANYLVNRAIRGVYSGKVRYWEGINIDVEAFFAVIFVKGNSFLDKDLDGDITWETPMTESTRAMIESRLDSVRVQPQSKAQSPESKGGIFDGIELGDEASFHIIDHLYFYVLGLREEGDITVYQTD